MFNYSFDKIPRNLDKVFPTFRITSYGKLLPYIVIKTKICFVLRLFFVILQ